VEPVMSDPAGASRTETPGSHAWPLLLLAGENEPELTQAVEHEHAGNAGADDDRVVCRDLMLGGQFRDYWCICHGVFPRSSCAMLTGVFAPFELRDVGD
jgi:hypothetical protein